MLDRLVGVSIIARMAAVPEPAKQEDTSDAAAAAPNGKESDEIKHAIESDHYAWAKDMKGRKVEEQSPEQL